MRWRIEEYFKFKKQSFDFENIRVQSLKSIRNLDLLLTIATGYVAEISGKSDNIKIRAEIIEVPKRLFGVPNFIYYAVADGIFDSDAVNQPCGKTSSFTISFLYLSLKLLSKFSLNSSEYLEAFSSDSPLLQIYSNMV